MKPYNQSRGKKEQVREMFDRIAPAYDRLNHTLSLGIDRLWRRRTVRIVRRMRPGRILDMATGTGDLALLLARRIPGAQVTGIDLSEGMLAAARAKAKAAGLGERIELVRGEAELTGLPDASFDVATVAFGVRNFEDLEGGLRELVRAVRPGGHVVILEFSTPTLPVWAQLYRWYSHRVLPRIGGLVSRDRQAYDYLPRSVDEFPQPGPFMRLMERAGLTHCRARSLSLGVAQIYVGERP